jgi:hypothetical protein
VNFDQINEKQSGRKRTHIPSFHDGIDSCDGHDKTADDQISGGKAQNK